MLGPGLAVGNVYGFWALGATVASAFAHTFLRALGRTDRPAAVVFWFQAVVTVYAFGALMVLDGAVTLPPPHLWGLLLAIGVVGTAGQIALTRAGVVVRDHAREGRGASSCREVVLSLSSFGRGSFPLPSDVLAKTGEDPRVHPER